MPGAGAGRGTRVRLVPGALIRRAAGCLAAALLLPHVPWLSGVRAVQAADLTLAWNRNTESDLAGYRVYVGLVSRRYTKSFRVGKGDPRRSSVVFRVTGLQRGTRYYFAAKAFDLTGNFSGFSNQVSYRVPPCADTMTAPRRPSGRTATAPGRALTFLARGAVDRLGHPVQYRFGWGNRRTTSWLPVGTRSARHRWAARGTYYVHAQARCAIHGRVLSGWSRGLRVTVR